jgi:hypothetical protein
MPILGSRISRALVGVGFVWALVGVTALVGPHVPTPLACVLASVPTVVLPGYAVVSWTRLDRDLPAAGTLAAIPVAGIAAWAPLSAVGFFAGLPFIVVAVSVLTTAGALFGSGRAVEPPPRRELIGILVGGALVAFLGSRWQAMLMGDGLFHAGVVRKILTVGRLSFRDVWQFKDGHPHAGYAFPLLHVVQAAIAWATRTDPSTAYNEMTPAFAFLIPIAAYGLGRTAAGRAGGVATAVLSVWGAMTVQGYLSYVQQPRYVVTFVVLPVFLMLLILASLKKSWVLEAAIGVTLLLVAVLHLTYTPPLLLMLGVVAVMFRHLRLLLAWSMLACGMFAAVIYLAAIRGGERLGPQPVSAINFVIIRGDRVALSGFELLQRRPEYLIAALAALVLVRHARSAIGILALCTVAMLALTALPGPLYLIQAVTGPGQALRYGEVVPWAYLLGPALVTFARRKVLWVIVLAVVSVIAAKSGVLHGHLATPLTVVIGVLSLVAVVAALAGRPRRWPSTVGAGSGGWTLALLAAVMLGPLLTTGRAEVHKVIHGKPSGYLTNMPTPGAISFLRAHQANLPVILAPYKAGTGCWYTGMAYELVGNAAVYTVAISSFHTESEPRDAPTRRRRDVDTFLNPTTAPSVRDAILRRYDVGYVVIDLKQAPSALISQLSADPSLHQVYRDPPTSDEYARFVIYQAGYGT